MRTVSYLLYEDCQPVLGSTAGRQRSSVLLPGLEGWVVARILSIPVPQDGKAASLLFKYNKSCQTLTGA